MCGHCSAGCHTINTHGGCPALMSTQPPVTMASPWCHPQPSRDEISRLEREEGVDGGGGGGGGGGGRLYLLLTLTVSTLTVPGLAKGRRQCLGEQRKRKIITDLV